MITHIKSFRVLRMMLAATMMALVATSCEVEFSPNAEWRNVPVVYCVLDQDDDTSWVRLERCYLSDDGFFNYGDNPDSINYKSGEVSVAVLAYEGGALRDSIVFRDTLRSRAEGLFASGVQPAYFALTKGRLKENYTYVLRVRNAFDNSLLASSKPIFLITTIYDQHIIYPKYSVTMTGDTLGEFSFADRFNGEACCKIEWRSLTNARLYQPVVRFFYEVEDTIKHLDLKCQRTTGSTVNYPRQTFLDDVKQRLQGDPRPKRYIPHVDIYLHCCTEDLHAYMETVSQSVQVDQNHAIYSNIEGGLGVFAARRMGVYKGMPSDDSPSSTGSNPGLYHLLEQLGVGIYM